MSTDSKSARLEDRYVVTKTHDPEGKHDDCRYFVLDPQHDPIALEVLGLYADRARRAGYGGLAKDLYAWRDRTLRAALLAEPERDVENNNPAQAIRRVEHLADDFASRARSAETDGQRAGLNGDDDEATSWLTVADTWREAETDLREALKGDA